MKPIYELTKNDDYWSATNETFHIGEVKMQQATGYFAFFFKEFLRKLFFLSGSYVHDAIQTRTEQEKRRIQHKLRNSFDVKVEEHRKFTINAPEININTPTHVTLAHLGTKAACNI